MAPKIPLILRAVLDEYVLPRDGDHGVAHWARVLENGLRLARETGANVEVVRLFAVLHDSRRVSEFTDPEHGPRAAEFARSLRGQLFDLPHPEFRLLYRACAGHTHERPTPTSRSGPAGTPTGWTWAGSGSPRTRAGWAPRWP